MTAAKANKSFNLFQFIHGYVYGRWPYLYIGIGKGDHPIAKRMMPLFALFSRVFTTKNNKTSQHAIDFASHTIADTYHGKAIPLQTARDAYSGEIAHPFRKHAAQFREKILVGIIVH